MDVRWDNSAKFSKIVRIWAFLVKKIMRISAMRGKNAKKCEFADFF